MTRHHQRVAERLTVIKPIAYLQDTPAYVLQAVNRVLRTCVAILVAISFNTFHPGAAQAQFVSGARQNCYVNDPTGTPLNVRTSPNGHMVGTLSNGTSVSLLDQTSDRDGRSWVYVGSPDLKPIGWVYREFLDCAAAAGSQVQAKEVKLPPDLLGYWCYGGNIPDPENSAVYDHAVHDHCLSGGGGGEDIIIRPNGYTSPEMQLSWGASPDALTCRMVHASVDRNGVYTIDFNKCPKNSTERCCLGRLLLIVS